MSDISLDDWQVENLRVSAFLATPVVPEETYSWQAVVGQPPQERRYQPQQKLATEVGSFLNGRLQLEIRSDRCDWQLVPDPGNISYDLPTLGAYAAVEEPFRRLMLKWLSNCPDIYRIAFGMVALLPADNLQDAYGKLAQFLSAVRIDVEGTQDLVYRINRRRNSRHAGQRLEINRLATWTALQIVRAKLDIGGPKFQQPPVTQELEPLNVCRLELDVNTMPEHKDAFEKPILEDVFGELAEAASEIAIKGDIP